MRDSGPTGPADPAREAGAGQEPSLSSGLAGFHRAAREALAHAGTSPAGSMDPRSAAPPYDRIVSALSEHIAVAERVLHPAALKRLPDRAPVDELARVAGEAVDAMRGIEQHLYGDARAPKGGIPELHERLVALLDEHTRLEEDLVDRLEAALDETERRALVARVEQAAAHAPTRPHPYAPHNPRLVPLAFKVNALWDDVLDAMDVRQVSGRTRRPPKPAGLWGSYLLGSGLVPDQPSAPEVAGEPYPADTPAPAPAGEGPAAPERSVGAERRPREVR